MREVEESGDPIGELRWMLERVARWDEPRLLNRVVQELVPRLIAISRFSEAITLTAPAPGGGPGLPARHRNRNAADCPNRA